MTGVSPMSRFGALSRRLGDWRNAAVALAALVLCDVAARLSVPRPDEQAMSDYFRRGGAGTLVELYDRLAGGGLSRGTVAALGVMPYLSARLCIALARRVSPALDLKCRRDDGRAGLIRWTRGLTLGIALVQSYGFARFVESIPGAVAQPGPGFVAGTMVVQTSVAMFFMWLAEQIMAPAEVDAGVSPEPVALAAGDEVTTRSARKTRVRERSR